MNLRWSIGYKLAVAFGLILTVQLLVGALAHHNLSVLGTSSLWVSHTEDVILKLEQLDSALADAESGQRGYLITGVDEYLAPYNQALGDIEDNIAAVRGLTADNPNQQRRLDTLEPLVDSKLVELRQTIELRRESGFEAAREVVFTNIGKRAMEGVRQTLAEMVREEEYLLSKRSADSSALARATTLSIVVGSIGATLVTLLALAFFTRKLASPLIGLTRVAEQIAEGDLTVAIAEEKRGDEIGILSAAFRRMVVTLRGSLAELATAVSHLSASAAEIQVATTQIATSAAETASAIQEITTTVEEVVQAADLSSRKAKEVSASSKRVAEVSREGRAAVQAATTGMERIREQMEQIAETVVGLGEQGQTIGGIIAAVTDLADQSNVLAVNAAIEATRAGEQGKGFEVVAQEIRNLSAQSKQATSEVRDILTGILRATGKTALATEQGSNAVQGGVQQTAQAGEAIRLLGEATERAAHVALQIEASSQQQLVGIEQIEAAMQNVAQSSAQNLASMRQMEDAARGLQGMGQSLKELTKQFKV